MGLYGRQLTRFAPDGRSLELNGRMTDTWTGKAIPGDTALSGNLRRPIDGKTGALISTAHL